MENKDYRVRVTKMLIRKEFTQLLKEKPVQSITVRELCERTGINRSTFYNHYQDVYDLLEQIENEMLGETQRAPEKHFSRKRSDVDEPFRGDFPLSYGKLGHMRHHAGGKRRQAFPFQNVGNGQGKLREKLFTVLSPRLAGANRGFLCFRQQRLSGADDELDLHGNEKISRRAGGDRQSDYDQRVEVFR